MPNKASIHKIIKMKGADVALRNELVLDGTLGEGYNKRMQSLHNSNAEALKGIIDVLGYPTIERVGKEASEAAWLIIQHSIGKPEFMRECRDLLEVAVKNKTDDPIKLAYLSDRIAVFEGRQQLFGTQFDWDEDGQLSPQRYDDLVSVNKRRLSLGLNSLEEQTETMRRQAKQENQHAPENKDERDRAYDSWRRQVGWIE